MLCSLDLHGSMPSEVYEGGIAFFRYKLRGVLVASDSQAQPQHLCN